METRSKVKGVPQGIPTTSFVEEVSKALPPTQGTYPTLRKQQLVEEFPESKFPLPSETTQFMFLLKNSNILSLSIIQLL
jgi:hypothetical protein